MTSVRRDTAAARSPPMFVRGRASHVEDLVCVECGTALADLPTKYPANSNPFLTGGPPYGPYVCTACLPAWNKPERMRARAGHL